MTEYLLKRPGPRRPWRWAGAAVALLGSGAWAHGGVSASAAPAPPAIPAAAAPAPAVETPRPAPLAVAPKVETRSAPLTLGTDDSPANPWLAATGRDALQSGLPSVARQLLRQALAQNNLDPATRDALQLDLAAAGLAIGEIDEADLALKAVADTSRAAYAVRAALVAERFADLGRPDAAERWAAAAALLARVDPAQLSPADRPWYFFAQGLLAEQRRDAAAAQAAWTAARDQAVNPAQRAQFEAELWRGQLAAGAATPELADTLQQQMAAAEAAGDPAGTQIALQYIICLSQLNRAAAALAETQKLLARLPDSDPRAKDRARLLLALLEARDATRPEGERVFSEADARLSQTELLKVLNPGGDRLTQELALSLLSSPRQLARDPAGLNLALAALTTDPRGHPLLDRIYLLQAQLALSQDQSAAAAAAAQKLFEEIPGSPWRGAALRLLAYTAWSGGRYPLAADYVNQLRAAVPEGPERLRLAGLLADLYFLSEDYLSAAETYGALLAPDIVPPAPRGALLLRAVESHLRAAAKLESPRDQAAQLDKAIALLDAQGSPGDADTVDRWKAEWNVLTALRDSGREAEAFARLDRLLRATDGPTALSPGLRVRLRWLAARLAVDLRDPAAATRAAALQNQLDALSPADAAVVGQATLEQLRASALLLQGQAAAMTPGQSAEFDRFMRELRSQFPKSDAAAFSFFFEAGELAAQNKTDKAQNLLSELAASHPESEYAPVALYEAALLAKARTQYVDALAKLKTLAERSTTDPRYQALLYPVLLQQGEIQRLNNNFDIAKAIYQRLLHDWPNDPRRPRTELAYVYCLIKQASDESTARLASAPARRAEARAALERLVNLPGLPVDARVEAGFNYADFVAHDGDPELAQQIYMRIISQYLLDPAGAAELNRQVEGRHWMARCLFELAILHEKQNHTEEARRLYELMIASGLYPEEAAERLKKRPPTTTTTGSSTAALIAPQLPAPFLPPPAPVPARGTVP